MVFHVNHLASVLTETQASLDCGSRAQPLTERGSELTPANPSFPAEMPVTENRS